MTKNFSRWDAAESFRSDEDARLFLEEVAKDGSADELRAAVDIAARYFGIAEIAKRTGCSTKEIYTELNSLDDTDTSALVRLLDRLGITPGIERTHSSDAAE